jgi:hypothetical protein
MNNRSTENETGETSLSLVLYQKSNNAQHKFKVIVMGPTKLECKEVDCIHLAQDMV